ncbi:MAG: glycosyltransferase [Bulleidia sp.]|nr:glycosyltransferase [Bulleidia sp.]
MKKITLVVPCFNEQEALPIFYREATSVMKEIDYEYELLFINDGSKDNTLKILKEIANTDKNVHYISFLEISEKKQQCMLAFVMLMVIM